MKIYVFLSILCCAVCLSACKKSNDNLPNSDPIEGDFLSQLNVGDELRYLPFDAESYGDPTNFNFSYLEDTLVLRVESIDGGEVTISESIIRSSPIDTSLLNFLTNIWTIENDTLKVVPKEETNSIVSYLYPFPLPMIDFVDEETTVQGWKTTFPYTEGDHNLFAKDVTILGNEYEKLNIAIRNTFMQLDLPGFTYMYDNEHGIVRMSVYDWWTSRGTGFDRIE